jgi:hypothetical protein
MAETNLGSVQANLKDVHGRTISDEVQFTFVNQRLRSLDRRVLVQFSGSPVTLSRIPATPTGLHQLFITPKRYREKSLFVNVPSDSAAILDETFFVEPSAVTPVFPNFQALQTQPQWAALSAVLEASGIDQQKYAVLSDAQRAGLLNLYAKMQAQAVDGGETVFSFIERITEIRPARFFALVREGLLESVQVFHEGFHPVPGTLHVFPTGWTRIDPSGSFKTFDRAGNLQLTFAKNDQNAYLVDADIDDHQGVEHAFDVLNHTFTGRDTNLYDIHEILISFRALIRATTLLD